MDTKEVLGKNTSIAIFDLNGKIVYPRDKKTIKTVKAILDNVVRDNISYIEDENKWYVTGGEIATINGERFQVVSFFDATVLVEELSHSTFDDITNLSTRRHARDQFIEYIKKAYTDKEDFAVIMADMDNFKSVNDTYGHLAGDQVLKKVSDILRDSTRHDPERDEDIIARLGGDEFVLILKNIKEQYAEDRAEEIRRNMDNTVLEVGSDEKRSVIKPGTLSVGLYYVPWEDLNALFEKGYSLDEIRINILNKCDASLYVSKNSGRNKVTSVAKGPIIKLV